MYQMMLGMKSDYPHSFRFLDLNAKFREKVFEILENEAIRSEERRIWIARRNELEKFMMGMEETFTKMLGDGN